MKPFEVKKVVSLNKTIRLPSDLCEEVEQLATASGISFNQFILQAVRYSLENLKSNEENSD